MPVVHKPDLAGFRPANTGIWTTGIAHTPSEFGTDGPTTVPFNTGAPAISVALAFADHFQSRIKPNFRIYVDVLRWDGRAG